MNDFTPAARRLGTGSAVAVVILGLAYAITLVVGFASLESPQDPIGDPMFTILEILIIVMSPAMVTLMVAVHAWAPPRARALSLAALVFMGLLAVLTCALHFVILTVSRAADFAGQPALMRALSFEWPSVAYAIDILAWDVFFALSMLFAAPVFGGSRLRGTIRALMLASGGLALAGLSGVVTGDMRLRNIGIVGYVGVFLVVAGLLAVLFHRTGAEEPRERQEA
ncbi:MAG TPA: hypothetical protein VLE53_10200 [Gemmatimonadaceae bacterium]|nr:hypothetical protein [Gemmatimonadaceae bacterium]